MIQATTQTIKTKITETEVVIKDWITAGEQQAVNSVIFDNVKIDMSEANRREGGNPVQDINPKSAVEMQNKQVEVYVVSVNGETENIMETLLSLPDADFQEVVSHINPSDESEQSKKNS